jgi:hypothetical protein
MTAALSGPCEACIQAGAGHQAAPPPAATMIQTPGQEGDPYAPAASGMGSHEQGQAPSSTVMMGQQYGEAPMGQAGQGGQMAPTNAWPPAPAPEPEGSTVAMPSYPESYSELGTTSAPIQPRDEPHNQPHQDLPTSAMPMVGGPFGNPPTHQEAEPPTAAADLSEPPTQAVSHYQPEPAGDEHESHTVILSSLPSLRTTTRLVVVEGPVHGRQFSLGRDRTTIGRSIGCHVTVEADSVGYDHARVVRAGDAWSLEVAGSGNDVFVNDDRVEGTRTLRNGDVIRIGPARLRFESSS